MSTDENFVAIARIIRPQGRKGEVLADLLTDFPEKLHERKKLFLGTEDGSYRRESTLQEHWLHKGRVVLKFAGVESIGDAEALTGMLVEIARSDRSKLEPGAIYISDLIGSALIDCAGEKQRNIGIVEEVQQGVGSAPLLVVHGNDREYEIPFASEYIVHFNASEHTLEMKLPKGMLEVNAPLSDNEKRQQTEVNTKTRKFSRRAPRRSL